MKQLVNSTLTTYTVDLAAGLTQVLVDVTSGVTNTYLYGNGRIAQHNSGSGASYFLGDALSSVRQLTDSSGNVTLTKSYEPYGDVLSSSGSGSSAYGFTGEWTDSTGLVYLRARYYAPYLNQFIQSDPIIGQLANPQTLNRYSYVTNNPVNLIDPSGYSPFGTSYITSPDDWQKLRIVNIAASENMPDFYNQFVDCNKLIPSLIIRTVRATITGLQSNPNSGTLVVHSYRKSELTRLIEPSEISSLSDESAAVRTLMAEMGPRLLKSRHAVWEGASILYTALNRLNTPLKPDPSHLDRWAKFTGCNDPGTSNPRLATCLAGGTQYALGSSTVARDPLCQSLKSCRGYWSGGLDPQKAVDTAAIIYYLFDLAVQEPFSQRYDPTGTAVYFSHESQWGPVNFSKVNTKVWREGQKAYARTHTLTIPYEEN